MPVTIENLQLVDLDKASRLIHKFWALNSEFEPTLELDEDYLEEIKKNVKASIADKRQMVLVARDEQKIVARDEQKIVGLVRVEVQDNPYYGKKLIGKIIELYVVPAHRRAGIAAALIDRVSERLSGQDMEILTAEFPTQNVLAAGFYESNSFTPFITVFAKRLKP
jgi:ribosomal protein S18 acetylase RimI-like enzyme